MKSEEQLLRDAMKSLETSLKIEYHLSENEVKEAMKISDVKNVFSQNIEMSLHDPIETWANVVYKCYINKK